MVLAAAQSQLQRAALGGVCPACSPGLWVPPPLQAHSRLCRAGATWGRPRDPGGQSSGLPTLWEQPRSPCHPKWPPVSWAPGPSLPNPSDQRKLRPRVLFPPVTWRACRGASDRPLDSTGRPDIFSPHLPLTTDGVPFLSLPLRPPKMSDLGRRGGQRLRLVSDVTQESRNRLPWQQAARRN